MANSSLPWNGDLFLEDLAEVERGLVDGDLDQVPVGHQELGLDRFEVAQVPFGAAGVSAIDNFYKSLMVPGK